METLSGMAAAVVRWFEGVAGDGILPRIPGAALTAFAIIAVFNIVQLVIGRLARNRPNSQRAFVIRKLLKYTGFAVATVSLLGALGINTAAIVGAAGVIGIAVGFAAQTTVSSFISGFFLISEKPFQVGDSIRVDGIQGEVLSVDVLSVKLRTFDNLFVRIPNETLFKSNLVNLSRFPIRRLDVTFAVTYSEDLERLRGILEEVAAANRHVLDNPAPLFRVDGFEEAGPRINLTVWFDKDALLETRTSMYMETSRRLAEEGIAIPHRRIEVRGVGEIAT